jgi:hypothetical protein
LNNVYDLIIERVLNIRDVTFKQKLVKLKTTKIPFNIRNKIKLKSRVFKLFFETNDTYYKFCTHYLNDKIGLMLEKYHSENYKKIIDKCDNFKTLSENKQKY